VGQVFSGRGVEDDGVGAGELSQDRRGTLCRVRVEAVPQRVRGERCGVECGVHGPLGGSGDDAAGAHHDDGGGDGQDQHCRRGNRDLARHITSHVLGGCPSP
jgi:hypothetical protein